MILRTHFEEITCQDEFFLARATEMVADMAATNVDAQYLWCQVWEDDNETLAFLLCYKDGRMCTMDYYTEEIEEFICFH